MKKILNVLSVLLMVVSNKVIQIARHPKTKVILIKGCKQAFSLLKIKAVRGIVFLYLSGLFAQMGLIDLSVAACLLLIIDNAGLVLSILGHGKRKRRYY